MNLSLSNNTDPDEDDFHSNVAALAWFIKQYGARDLWLQMKVSYPKEFNELLYYGLDMVKK